ETKILQLVSAHDIGRAINPQQAEGQIEGGVAQAVGYAVLEHLVSEGGILKNFNFTGYILPTASDTPPIVPIVVESGFSGGPFGAKGLAESPIVGPAAAIANAIAHATGTPIDRLPAIPEVVRAAIRRVAAPARAR